MLFPENNEFRVYIVSFFTLFLFLFPFIVSFSSMPLNQQTTEQKTNSFPHGLLMVLSGLLSSCALLPALLIGFSHCS